jgi:hypothetical protein
VADKNEMARLRAVRDQALNRGKIARDAQRAGRAGRAGREVARLERQDFKDKQR